MECFYHPGTNAVGLCGDCTKAACRECLQDVGGYLLCKSCLELHASEQQRSEKAQKEQEQRTASRHALKLRIGRYLFVGTLVFAVVMTAARILGTLTGALEDPQLNSAGDIVAFLAVLPFGALLAAYILWAAYWGELAAWRYWLNLTKKVGCFIHATLVGWLILLFLFLTIPSILGVYYGVFGGGYREYRRTKQLAVQA